MNKRDRRLTPTQKNYLAVIRERGRLTQGWGGYSSTLTVRILAERGYIQLRENYAGTRWLATPA